MRDRAGGFSLVELLMAMAVMVTFSSALMALILAGQAMARAQPEAADVQQRARVALQTLGAELALAGAGLDRGAYAGPLATFFSPVGPSGDGGITVWYVSGRAAQASLAGPLTQTATDVPVLSAGWCPVTDPACAFTQASAAIVFDGRGCHDVVRIETVTPALLRVRPGVRACAYTGGAAIAQGEVRTYRVDPGARQLMRRDEATGTSVPVLDNVTAMGVEYLDDGRRVRVTLRLDAASGNPMVPGLEVSCDVRPPNLQVP